MNLIQLSVLTTNQILLIKNGGRMELSRNIAQFRTKFKSMVGLPKNASHKLVLDALRQVYINNGLLEDFNEKLINLKSEVLYA